MTSKSKSEALATAQEWHMGQAPATFVKVLEPSLSLRDRSKARCQRDVNRRPQPTATRKPENGCTRPDQGLAATHRNHLRRNGKEGVNGSSPLEGFAEGPCKWRFHVPRVPTARAGTRGAEHWVDAADGKINGESSVRRELMRGPQARSVARASGTALEGSRPIGTDPGGSPEIRNARRGCPSGRSNAARARTGCGLRRRSRRRCVPDGGWLGPR
jgi:hypothetical protein